MISPSNGASHTPFAILALVSVVETIPNKIIGETLILGIAI